jgi:hypothetical protein
LSARGLSVSECYGMNNVALPSQHMFLWDVHIVMLHSSRNLIIVCNKNERNVSIFLAMRLDYLLSRWLSKVLYVIAFHSSSLWVLSDNEPIPKV